jgi:hypothetical protein
VRVLRTLALLLCTPAAVAAQSVMAGAEVVDADHYLVGEPLVGVGVRLTTPLRLAGAPVFLRVGTASSRSERYGSPCGGFVPPGVCSPQPVEDHTRMTSGGVGLSAALMSRGQFDVGLDMEANVARWKATSRGRTSGETGDAAEIHLGAAIGLHTSFRPARRLPLAFEIGAGAAASNKPPGYEVVDGYTPFAELITQIRYHVGVAWRL